MEQHIRHDTNILDQLVIFCVHLLRLFFQFCRGQLTSVKIFHNASWATQGSADVSIFEGTVHYKLEYVPSTADRGPYMLLFPAGALLQLCWNRNREPLLWFSARCWICVPPPTSKSLCSQQYASPPEAWWSGSATSIANPWLWNGKKLQGMTPRISSQCDAADIF